MAIDVSQICSYPSRVMSIDMGINGGIAILLPDIRELVLFKMPCLNIENKRSSRKDMDYDMLLSLMARYYVREVVFEDVSVIFGSSKITAFRMAYQKGFLLGMCKGIGVVAHTYRPLLWQREIFSRYGKEDIADRKDRKRASIAIANDLIDSIRESGFTIKREATGKRAKGDKLDRTPIRHDGIADAINILNYHAIISKKSL